MRRRFVPIALVAAFLVSACGSAASSDPASAISRSLPTVTTTPMPTTSPPETATPTSPPPAPATTATLDTGTQTPAAPATVVRPASKEAIRHTIEGMRDLTGNLSDITQNAGENSVFSPASLAYAFAMLRAGARGQTERQLDTVFGYPGDNVHGVMRWLRRKVVTTDEPPPRTQPGEQRTGHVDPIVAIANGLFAQQGVTLGNEFIATLRQAYGAPPETVDFTHDDAEQRINDWADENTAGRVKKVFDSIDPATVAVIGNAVYLKADWERQFNRKATRDEPFRLANGDSVMVPMMSQGTMELRYATGDGWHAAELPYAGDELAMWVLVPEDVDGTPPVLTAETFAALDDATERHVEFAMPRWDFGTTMPLLPTLRRLGLTDLTNLSRMAPGAFVSDAIHRANITVDERGTEAAAVTGIAVPTSAPKPEVTVRADHPFCFVITHRTGVPLFVGQVADPR